jgi:DNA-binding IclR family transcriptional regulator
MQNTEKKKKGDKVYEVSALRKGIRLIELLCESEVPLGVTEISQQLEINKHMVFRMLATLVDEGWVIKEDDGPRYRMGLAPFRYASMPVARTDLVDASTIPMKSLWDDVGESIGLAVLDDDRVMYLLHHNGKRSISISGKVGHRYLVHCSAPGKLLVAHADEVLIDRIIAQGLPKQTAGTIVSESRFREELELVRERGYALDVEEYADGGMCYSAPVYDYSGKVAAALNISVLTLHYRLDELVEDLGSRVSRTAEQISRAMGLVKNGESDHEASE